MKKKWMAAALALLALTACDKMTTDLEGKWQLKEIEAGGVRTAVDTVWYNFQTSLFMYQLYEPATEEYKVSYGLSYYDEGEEIRLELNNDALLPRTDWESRIRTFTIEKVSGKKLVLWSEGKRYYFDKF